LTRTTGEGRNVPKTEDRRTDPVILLEASLQTVVATAARAPSPHNTQPWTFSWHEGALELRADRSRALAVADPAGRELTIACGAALFNARLATNHLGVQTKVELVPGGRDPDLLARIVPTGLRDPLPEGEQLHAVVPYRHTHRGPFTNVPVDPALLVELESAASIEDTVLHLVQHPGHRSTLGKLLREAERSQMADPRFRAEVEAWTPAPGDRRRDGVPPTAYPHATGGPSDEFPVRDWSMGRGWGAEGGQDDIEPVIAVLATSGDHVADWLTAGQALQRVLLTAARRWVFAAMLTQPLELPHLRAVIRDELALDGFPQVAMRLGHADSAPTTPRRRVDEILDPGQDSA
jgi:nitroreductase